MDEQYLSKVSIHKKETNCIIFDIESSRIKETTSIQYRSPVFAFEDNPKENCYLSFVSSVTWKDCKISSQKVPGMTLHFLKKQENHEEVCTYQVVGSILKRPELGIHAFQSQRYGIYELNHWEFFSLNELSIVTNKTGIVQICFDITRFVGGDMMSIESTFIPQTDKRMLKLYSFAKNEDYTDVTLKVGNEEIKAHKNILATHSDVFDAMFKSKMKEGQTGIIKVEEFKPHVIRQMIYYIYTNEIEDLSKVYLELFEAAHFYNLSNLEVICKDYMLSNITVNNVIPLLELAEKYSLKDIQSKIDTFIKSNETQVVKSTEYLDYLISRLCVKNVAKCLVLADKHKLKDFKTPLKEFVMGNIKEVIKDSKYRYLYTTNINIILEIDEYMADHKS